MEESARKIYISICHPSSSIPMLDKMVVFVPEGESEVQLAKKIRAKYAKNPQLAGYTEDTPSFKPAELAWAIFYKMFAANPSNKSDNWPDEVFSQYLSP